MTIPVAPLEGGRRRACVYRGAARGAPPTERAHAGERCPRDPLDFTRYDVRDCLHHNFWVPINAGVTAEWARERAPGWTFFDVLRALRAAGALQPHHQMVSGYVPAPGLRWVRLAPSGRCAGILIDSDRSEELPGTGCFAPYGAEDAARLGPERSKSRWVEGRGGWPRMVWEPVDDAEGRPCLLVMRGWRYGAYTNAVERTRGSRRPARKYPGAFDLMARDLPLAWVGRFMVAVGSAAPAGEPCLRVPPARAEEAVRGLAELGYWVVREPGLREVVR